MRKLIWCAAAGAVAAGSAWATAYAWNHQDALARRQLASTCVVGLAERMSPPKPLTAAAGPVQGGEAAAETRPNSTVDGQLFVFNGQVPGPKSGADDSGENNPGLQLSMPVVIRDDANGSDAPKEDTEAERAAVLEQLPLLIRELSTAEVPTDDTLVYQELVGGEVAAEPMTNADGEVPVPVTAQVEGERALDGVLREVVQLFWTTPVLGPAEGAAGDVAEVTAYLEAVLAQLHTEYAVQDGQQSDHATNDVMPRAEEMVEIPVIDISFLNEWLSHFGAEEENGNPPTPDVPMTTVPDVEGFNTPDPGYAPTDLPVPLPLGSSSESHGQYCPYTGQFYPDPPTTPSESPDLKAEEAPASKSEQKAIEVKAEDDDTSFILDGDLSGVQGVETDGVAKEAASDKAGGENAAVAGVLTESLVWASALEVAPVEKPTQGVRMVASSMARRVKEALSDCAHMIGFDDAGGPFDEAAWKLLPKTSSGSSKVDTAEFRPSDHTLGEDEGTGPY